MRSVIKARDLIIGDIVIMEDDSEQKITSLSIKPHRVIACFGKRLFIDPHPSDFVTIMKRS